MTLKFLAGILSLSLLTATAYSENFASIRAEKNNHPDEPFDVLQSQRQMPSERMAEVIINAINQATSSALNFEHQQKKVPPSNRDVVYRNAIPFEVCTLDGIGGQPFQTKSFHEHRPPTGFFRTLSEIQKKDPKTYEVYRLLVVALSSRVKVLAHESLRSLTSVRHHLLQRIYRKSHQQELLEQLKIVPLLARQARFELALARSQPTGRITLLSSDLWTINYDLAPIDYDPHLKGWTAIDPHSEEGRTVRAYWEQELRNLSNEVRAENPALSSEADKVQLKHKVEMRIENLRKQHEFRYLSYLTILPILRLVSTSTINDYDYEKLLKQMISNARAIFEREDDRLTRLNHTLSFEYRDIEVIDYLPIVHSLAKSQTDETCPLLVSLYYHRLNNQYRYLIPTMVTAFGVFAVLPPAIAVAGGAVWAGYDFWNLFELRHLTEQGTVMGITSQASVFSSGQIHSLNSALQEQAFLSIIQVLPAYFIGRTIYSWFR